MSLSNELAGIIEAAAAGEMNPLSRASAEAMQLIERARIATAKAKRGGSPLRFLMLHAAIARSIADGLPVIAETPRSRSARHDRCETCGAGAGKPCRRPGGIPARAAHAGRRLA